MRLVPLSPPVWQTFSSWFQFAVPPPKQGIFIADTIDGQEHLLGGVCIYETDGIYTLFEHFALNPEAPAKLKHEVARSIFNGAKSYLTINAKVGFAWISFDGGVQLAAKAGFKASETRLMTFTPSVVAPEPQPRPERRAAPKEEPEAAPEEFQEEEDEDARLEREFSASAEATAAEVEEDDDLVIEPEKPMRKSKKKRRSKKKASRRSLA